MNRIENTFRVGNDCDVNAVEMMEIVGVEKWKISNEAGCVEHCAAGILANCILANCNVAVAVALSYS